MFRIELETPTTATVADTMLLYALAEELLITKKWVVSYHRMSKEIVAVEITAVSRDRALMQLYNALRCSKNYMAHICAVTVIE